VRLLPVACVLACLSAAAVAAPSGALAGETAAPFSLRGLDGKAVRLSDFKGQPVVLDFWATWCGPCRASMPHLDQIQEHFQPQGLVVIGLSVDDGPTPVVRRYAERLGVRFRMAMANEGVLDDYGPIRSIPTTIFINRHGEVVRRVVGYIDAETMEGFTREILGK
jgi:thiol-disulfide isomerase/thioredoxin